MFVEPGVQVNPVINATPPQPDKRHIQLIEKRRADAQIDRRLILGQTTHGRQRQT